ncbi:uncharacterized protein [Nicotiana sylvestris]|uniref:uncharacterized protein n=1 Tax=Nicotiana sylvestris TaxID=4096 RepID=UPI00388CE631
MTPFEAIYSWRCRSPIGWFEPDEAKLYGTNLVKDALEKVKSIQERLRTAQTREKSYTDQKAHDVSFMRYHANLSHMLDSSTIQLDERLGYDDEPVAIVARQDRQLRSKRISTAKVQWKGQPAKEVTWESEEDMRSRYPYLFSTPGMILNSLEDERLFKKWRM